MTRRFFISSLLAAFAASFALLKMPTKYRIWEIWPKDHPKYNGLTLIQAFQQTGPGDVILLHKGYYDLGDNEFRFTKERPSTGTIHIPVPDPNWKRGDPSTVTISGGIFYPYNDYPLFDALPTGPATYQ